ncbi:MAG TPA: transcriptional regulator NrdR [Gemmataceae bacterium]|jgi:transcriptional repressor NrdR|nr:transcriptional regulator NrdR [Gemmataceae bacterium]
MKCPFCKAGDFAVVDSRSHDGGFPIRRRRVCHVCKRRVTTIEQVEETPLKVVKKDRSREPFDPAKLRRSLELACGKRPISSDQIEAIVRQIETYVYSRFFTEVPSSELGELVMEHLQKIDQVAYVRYASVYREFKDVSDFVEEVEPMLSKTPNGARRRARKPDSEAPRSHDQR